MQNKYKVIWFFAIFILTTLACGQISYGIITPTTESSQKDKVDDIPEVPQESPEAKKTPQPQPEPTPEIDPSYLEKINLYPSTGGSKWVLYNNPDFGFAFQYPNRWQLSEHPAMSQTGQEYANAITLTNGIYQLMIWFKSTSVDAQDVTFVMPSNSEDRITWEEVDFLGDEITKTLVLEDGVEVAFLYGGGEWVGTGNLAFAVFLVNVDKGANGIPIFNPDLAKEVERIIASLVAAGIEYTPPTPVQITDDLPCDSITEGSLGFLVCNLRDAIRSDNLSAVIYSMANPFPVGYWGSEWTLKTPQEVFDELRIYRLPQYRSILSFTINHAQFPEFYGSPPEKSLGPEVNVVMVIYSEGWGQDGFGSALLFIAEPSPGNYQWNGIIYSHEHFDK